MKEMVQKVRSENIIGKVRIFRGTHRSFNLVPVRTNRKGWELSCKYVLRTFLPSISLVF